MSGSGIQKDTYVSTATHSKYEFEWVIKNFSVRLEIVKGEQSSAKFPYNTDGKMQWMLNFNPKSQKDEIFCSLFLELVSPLESQDKFMVKFDLFLVDSNSCVIHQDSITSNYAELKCWGRHDFFKRNVLLEKVKPADKLCIKCKISTNHEIANENFQKCLKPLPEPLPSSLSKDLQSLVDSNKFGDVTILIDGHRFLAYKGILSARSVVFAAMFAHELLENLENCITIRDVEPEVFKQLLRYIYTDKVTSLETMCQKLYTAADKYAITTLKSLCRNHILEKLNWETAAETLVLAEMHSDNVMKERALEFLSGHEAGKVTSTAGWRKMFRTHPYLVDETVKVLAARKTISKD